MTTGFLDDLLDWEDITGTGPHSQRATAVREHLENIQGSIVKSPARERAVYIVLKFNEPGESPREEAQVVREKLAALPVTNAREELLAYRRHLAEKARDGATSPAQVDDLNREIQALDEELQGLQNFGGTRKQGAFCYALLSASGYRKLLIPEELMPRDHYFRSGMLAGDEMYHENDVSEWDPVFVDSREKEGGKGPADALIVLAGSNKGDLLALYERVQSDLKPHCQTFMCLPGQRVFRDIGDKRYWVEHFGFNDGVTQLEFIRKPGQAQSGAPTEHDENCWDPQTPLNVVLASESWDRPTYGSYLAFQIIEQLPAKYQQAMQGLARELGLDAKEWERAAALAFGRHPDGTPLVKPNCAEGDSSATSNSPLKSGSKTFTYAADPDGQQCPFHAHIRKMNPRGDTTRKNPADGSPEFERRIRIARRGIPYEELWRDNPASLPDQLEQAAILRQPAVEGGVGLLFASYQAELFQFAFHQWAGRYEEFVQKDAGSDPIGAYEVSKVPQTWPSPNGGAAVKKALGEFTKMRGGEYFFAPSLEFLRSLKQPDAIGWRS